MSGSIWDTTKFTCTGGRSSFMKSPALMCAELGREDPPPVAVEQLNPKLTTRQQWAAYMRSYRRKNRK